MSNEPWHLSKSVPLSIIFAVVAQTVTLVWFIAGLNASIESNSRDLVRHETRIEALETSVQNQAIAVARMDENIQAIRSMLEQMARGR
jgi:NhaP-type Na+/H+ or K+/H+ antiporter